VNEPQHIVDERKKRFRELAFALGGLVLIAVILVIEFQIARSSDSIAFGRHMLLFVLSGVVILLLILVIFFLIRNLFKLIFERRRNILGSRLKTRLTIAFVALTLVPTVLLFVAAAGAVSTSIEFWFSTQVDESMRSAMIVAQMFDHKASQEVRDLGSRLGSAISSAHLTDDSEAERVHGIMEKWRSAEKLAAISLYYRRPGSPLVVKDPGLKHLVVSVPRPSFLKIAFQGEKSSKIIHLDDGADLHRAVVPIRGPDDSAPVAALVVDQYIPRSLARRLLPIYDAFKDYQETKRIKGPVKAIYILILLTIALLVIFIGFWFGMSMARDITEPIEKLAGGTGKIAAGDLNVFIEPVADDELGVLVRSFNKMTEDLRKGREELTSANQDLDSRRKYMETVLKNVAAGVLALDSEGRITTVNRSAIRILGMNGEELIGKDLLKILPEVPAATVGSILGELAASAQESIARQVTLSYPDRSVSLICFANMIQDEGGVAQGLVLVLEDVTHIVKAQRMAAWREVARRIAHEIKNPLTPIQLNAQRVRRKYLERLGEDGAVLEQCTETIIDQVEQLKNMVNEFSQFARMPSANPVPGDLNALIREVVQLYSQGRDGTAVSFEPDPSVPTFDLDPEQIKRAVVNLVDNAISEVGDSGHVSLKTGYDPELAIATIEVSDDGPGIDPTDRDRLFEPYFTTKPGGTGLGLTIVSTIVADHNGFVRVKDNPEGGAAFVIELPAGKKSLHPGAGMR
jgi:two-component system, NtrC family, nitrogen regulation sensor histidine kinase NtrY